MRLLLIRHGRVAPVASGWALDRAAVVRWRAVYDGADLAAGVQPPAALAREVACAAVIAASDLPRARASAARLAPGRSVRVSVLLREEPLPLPALHGLRAPRPVWEALILAGWGLAIARGRDATPEARVRAAAAAAWCRGLGAEGARRDGADAAVAVVTHGVFRRLLARALVLDGWHAEPGRRSYAHWSVWRFRLGAGERVVEADEGAPRSLAAAAFTCAPPQLSVSVRR